MSSILSQPFRPRNFVDRLYPKEFHSPNHGNSFTSFGAAAAAVGGWVELARTTAGSTVSNLDVSGLDDKRYYMVLGSLLLNGSQDLTFRAGNSTLQTGNVYASRRNENGASDITDVSRTNMIFSDAQSTTQFFNVNYLANLSAKEKLQMGLVNNQSTAGAATPPNRTEVVNKLAFTSNLLDIFSYDQTSLLINSEMVVLGWDPSDVHTTNFFGEEGSASGSTLDITLSTARKYMWSQFLVRAGSASTTLKLRVGNGSLDSSNNYALRQSDDGSADGTTATTDGITLNTNALAANELLYVNVFMLNIAAQEKLLIIHTVDTNTGLGATNATGREEIVAKHVNTSNLDDHIGIVATSGSISATSSQGTSWGGD